MPTYEYECLKCRRVFEIRQRISEPALTVCDVCGGEVRRLLSPAPFILKGGGWYVTDYPSESRKQALQSEKSSDKPSEKSSDKPSEKAADKPTTSGSTPAAPSTTKSD
jgi:putative FmdB family regulatory protein